MGTVATRRLGDRRVEHEAAQLIDATSALGLGDELRRRYQTTGRVIPPGQDLDTGQVASGEIDDGLVLHADLVVADGISQLSTEPANVDFSRATEASAGTGTP